MRDTMKKPRHKTPSLAKRAGGKTTPRTRLLFTALAGKPIVTLEDLRRRLPDYKSTPQMGGMKVPDQIAEELFTELQADSNHGFAPRSVEDIHRVAAERRARRVEDQMGSS
jgi:hypothetical protein